MIITISQYKKYFGSHDRKKSIHEISMKLWQTDFSQKNAKIFMNMSQIDKSSLWIERTCLKTCFKTLSFSRKNMRLKNFFEFFQFLWSPQSFCGVPKNWKWESLVNPLESPKTEKWESLVNPLESPKTEKWESQVNPLESPKKNVESQVGVPKKKTRSWFTIFWETSAFQVISA